jgi:hypothetical protein
MAETSVNSEKSAIFMKISKKWLKFTIGIMIVVHISINFVIGYQTYAANYIYPITLNLIILQGVMYIIAYIFCLTQLDNRFGTLLSGALLFYTADSFVFRLIEEPTDYTLAIAIWGAIILIGIIAILFVLIRLVILTKIERKMRKSPQPDQLTYLNRMKNTIKSNNYRTLILFIITISVFTGYSVTSQKSYGQEITITPQEYQIEFRIWGQTSPEWYQKHPYGAAILEQYERHNVIVQNTIFSIRDENNLSLSFSPKISAYDKNKTITTLRWFETNYPKVRFQYYAFGLGYGSCGNYEGSIYTGAMLKRFVDICREANFTNIAGVYTDWEGPSREAPKNSNTTRNGWHQAMWTDAFAYVRAYYPDWILSCCHPHEVLYDRVDNDDDLQYYDRFNIFNPLWDDYGPMVYRSCDVEGTTPDTYGGSWGVYTNAKVLVDGALRGEVSRSSFWLGCTGCGPYGNNTVAYEHGEPMKFGDGKGFDAFARDVLILKAFKIPTVSIFHGIEHHESGDYLTGFFHQYGYADALDKLNETVNGKDSTKSFIIWSEGNWNPIKFLTTDFQLNFNQLIYIPLALGYLFVGYLFAQHEKILKFIRRGQQKS